MSSAVRLVEISKSFDSRCALDKVTTTIESGTLHAIVGENGAGKTTLMRILYGALQPDAGYIELFGKSVALRSSVDAIRHEIGMVSQHYGIVPGLNCLENLMLGAEPSQWIDIQVARKRANILTDKMGFKFNWESDAEDLSPSNAQKLEILKLLWKNAKILILDEPTAMLSPSDSDALFASLKVLVNDGATAIIVTHRISEVLSHCDAVTVLRGGKLISESKVRDQTGPELAAEIVGKTISFPIREHVADPGKESFELLKVTDLHVQEERGNAAIKGIDFTLNKGEILGIAGVDGSGQRELIQVLLGIRSKEEGQIIFDGADLSSTSPSERMRVGLRLIAEDRLQESMIAPWSLECNAALGHQMEPDLQTHGWINHEHRLSLANRVATRFGTKFSSLEQEITSLSGGNQQRFVAARALEYSPKLILAFQPARGLDIGSTQDVYNAIRSACSAGCSAIIVSFDLDELLENCDRIGSMFSGKLSFPPVGHEMERDVIGRQMVGLSA